MIEKYIKGGQQLHTEVQLLLGGLLYILALIQNHSEAKWWLFDLSLITQLLKTLSASLMNSFISISFLGAT